MNKINEFSASIWENHKINWKEIKPDVNIIVGINGKGKTTLLDRIYKQYSKDSDCIYIRSIDNIALRDKRKVDNALSQELEYYLFDTKVGPSLMTRRTLPYDSPDITVEDIKQQEEEFIHLVNELLADTNKIISLKASNDPVVIGDKRYPISVLSSGEKQLLLILLRVFLSKGTCPLVLIDEPENSLHISWQSELINILTKLNPSAQYIITTHSPSIFGDGWGDKVVYIENIVMPQE